MMVFTERLHDQKVSKTRLSGLVLMLLSVMSVSPQALADLGQINLIMRATLVSNACSVSAGSANQTVNLGTWAVKQFVETPQPLPLIRFTINLVDCGPAASGVKVTFNGIQDTNNNQLFKLNAGSTASRVGVAILDRNRNRIPPGWTSIPTQLTGNATNVPLVFFAQYVATGGVVTAGSANADATFTMEYL
jgi:minor fimbrial subunit